MKRRKLTDDELRDAVDEHVFAMISRRFEEPRLLSEAYIRDVRSALEAVTREMCRHATREAIDEMWAQDEERRRNRSHWPRRPR